ncbi:unnamed protein product [Meloidogyne enterolobii]|uniref:Uncharacterized protein n=1 Tax=Meloidogyne enterolobii TaxID=390850 RepID=A0ACB1AYE1_MELEN
MQVLIPTEQQVSIKPYTEDLFYYQHSSECSYDGEHALYQSCLTSKPLFTPSKCYLRIVNFAKFFGCATSTNQSPQTT